ncbi:hypothetical protein BRADI_2g40920v3 [Brachypodium distachyon]|uniref:RWP-RK domain-containing protein n=2 Tax=Brachypodium distachyon TaxID=15368 RepID=A0A0Q3GCN4_BRADI|nr:hypothetical protein BRADI_2g40920v3 [Brachypodium distachyon]
MQRYYSGDADRCFHDPLAPFPLCSSSSSSSSPPSLFTSDESCLSMAAALFPGDHTGQVEDCSSALMLREDADMTGYLPISMIPAPAAGDNNGMLYPDNVLPPFPEDLSTVGLDLDLDLLDDALLMLQPLSDIDLEAFGDMDLQVKPEPEPEELNNISVILPPRALDQSLGPQPQQAAPMQLHQQNAARHGDSSSIVVSRPAAPAGAVVGIGYAEPQTQQQRAAPRARRIIREGSNAAGGRSLENIGFEELRKYFYMPITKAARELNVGLTVLKKRCRELGVARWPHRKMKSLRSLILNIQEMGRGGGVLPPAVQRELEALERACTLMEKNPAIELTEQTKKLRQAYFKENYKKRRAAAVNVLDGCYGGHQQQLTPMPLPMISPHSGQSTAFFGRY